MKKKSFFQNAAIITVGGFLAKGIGALYKFPLVGALGGYGMGLYQMSYPFFCLILTFSSAGVPSAFARMIAREREDGRSAVVKTALKLFLALGLCGTFLMMLAAPAVGRLQGETALSSCYAALAPAVFLVALIAVLRGYFQGKSDMVPTAVSEIIEQVVKAGAGLLLAFRFSAEPVRAVTAALFAVTLSETAALFYLSIRYLREGKSRLLPARRTTAPEVLFAALPVMTAAALLPLSRMLDSVLLVRLLSRHSARAVSLYGLLTGGALPLVHLPATLCSGLAAAAVPSVSRAMDLGEEEAVRRALRALALSFAVSVPCAVGIFLFARPAVHLLYGGLGAEDAEAVVSLVRLLSVSAVTISAVDVLAASLTGMGRAKHAAFAMGTAVIIKLCAESALARNPAFSVGGAAIAVNLCYLVAFFLDLFYTVRKKRVKQNDHGCKSRDGAGRADPAGGEGALGSGRSARPHRANSFGADA